jgi:hypothetical protein
MGSNADHYNCSLIAIREKRERGGSADYISQFFP